MLPRTFYYFGKPATNMPVRFFCNPHKYSSRYDGNAKAVPCELILMPNELHQDTLNNLPIKLNSGFIRTPSALYHVNKLLKHIKAVTSSDTKLKLFDEAMKPTNESRILSEDELKKIYSITHFSLIVDSLTSKEEIEMFIDDITKQMKNDDDGRRKPGSTTGPY